MTSIPATFDDFFRGFAFARPLLMLDYDGTLAPFHADRFQATPWPGARDVLQKIQDQDEDQGKTRMVIVTGRPADEIASLLGLRQPLEVWGLHGFERLHSNGRREQEQLPEAVARKLGELHRALGRDSFGGLLEAKPNAAVMHWRGVPAEEATRIEQCARALFEPALAEVPGFRLLAFDGGIELRAGRDKSAAVQALLAESPPDAPAAYLGDDLTDEAAFRAINASRLSTEGPSVHSGPRLSVLVRPQWRETAADVWLKPPDELLQFLQRWVR